jgi:hypothetical protein
MTTIAKLPISDTARDLTISVQISGAKTFRVRLWLGAKLIHLAARVIGCKCEIEVRK